MVAIILASLMVLICISLMTYLNPFHVFIGHVHILLSFYLRSFPYSCFLVYSYIQVLYQITCIVGSLLWIAFSL